MIARIKRLIMESVPYEPGRSTNGDTLFGHVSSYCDELGFMLTDPAFRNAIKELHDEQCIVRFSDKDIRPTQYGLNRYG